jgi:hypothetical protein
MTNITDLTTGQLNSIIALKEQIEELQSRIDSIAAGGDFPIPVIATKRRRRMSRGGKARIVAAVKARWAKYNKKAKSKPAKKGKRRLSAAGRAAIIAGTKARWARVKGKTATPKGAKKKDRRSSPAVRAKLAEAARARWAKVKAEGKKTL